MLTAQRYISEAQLALRSIPLPVKGALKLGKQSVTIHLRSVVHPHIESNSTIELHNLNIARSNILVAQMRQEAELMENEVRRRRTR